MRRLHFTPFGMDECAVCDAPATCAILTEEHELIPACEACARAEKNEIPNTTIYLIGGKA